MAGRSFKSLDGVLGLHVADAGVHVGVHPAPLGEGPAPLEREAEDCSFAEVDGDAREFGFHRGIDVSGYL